MSDLFGRIMRAAYRGELSEHTLERDDGYLNDSTSEQYLLKYDDWPIYEKRAIQLARGKCLDIGCGAGRVGLYLQQKGLHVVGIDISPGALDLCKERGLKNAQLMSAEDMDFPTKHFDTVILFGNNFGILGEPERVVGMLKRLYEVTTDDAVILAETRDVEDTDRPVHLNYHARNREEGKLPGLVSLRMIYGNEKSEWFDLLMVGSKDMADIAAKAGWSLEEVIKDDSNCYIGVLRKR